MSLDIRPGYKQTEAGVIPEDWDVRPLGQLVHAVEYGSSAKSSSSGKVPVLRMGNLQEGNIDWSDLVYTDNENEIAKYLLNPGDVLFNRTNTVDLVGKTAIYKGGRSSIFAGYLIRIKEKKDLIDPRYLNYFLNSKPAKNYGLKILSVAVGQANINGQKLKTYPTPLPPTVDEQNSIATAISEMEELISRLDQLLAKKRDIQKATMQQLLTGQRRLPGFSGEWRDGEFRDVVRSLEAGVSVNSTDNLPEPGLPCVLKTSALSGGNFLPNEAKAIVAADRARAYTNPRRNTILISRMNTPALVGEIAYVEKDYDWLFLPDRLWMTQLMSDDCVNVRWLAYLLSSRPYRKLLQDAATGTSGSMKNISKGVLLNLQISYPAIEEQTAIATILSDMDAELAALKSRRDKARLLKQGMMQELLTGRIRLV